MTDLGVEGTDPIHVGTGHLLFLGASGAFAAVPFDLDRREVTGTPSTALTDVLATTGELGFSVSEEGTAVYARGDVEAAREVVEVSLDGTVSPTGSAPRAYLHPRYSPDGRVVAYEISNALWLYDRETGSNERISEGSGSHPVRSIDGRHVYYSPSMQAVARRAADGSSESEIVHTQDGFVFPLSAAPSGEELVVTEGAGESSPSSPQAHIVVNWFEEIRALSGR